MIIEPHVERLANALLNNCRDENDLGDIVSMITNQLIVRKGYVLSVRDRTVYLDPVDGTNGEWEISISSRDKFNWHNPRLVDLWGKGICVRDEQWAENHRIAFGVVSAIHDAIIYGRLQHVMTSDISIYADSDTDATYLLCGKFVLCVGYRSDPAHVITSNGVFRWLDAMAGQIGQISDDDIVCAGIEDGRVVISVNGQRLDTKMKRHQFQALFD